MTAPGTPPARGTGTRHMHKEHRHTRPQDRAATRPQRKALAVQAPRRPRFNGVDTVNAVDSVNVVGAVNGACSRGDRSGQADAHKSL
jgi:hypothetical protein